jgi:hypothetical protein
MMKSTIAGPPKMSMDSKRNGIIVVFFPMRQILIDWDHPKKV